MTVKDNQTDDSVEITRPEIGFLDLVVPIFAHWRRLLLVPLAAGALSAGATYLLDPIYTARTSLLPPRQQSTAVGAALGSLGGLAGLAGAATKSPDDQYVGMLASQTIADRLIDQFDLMKVYEVKYRFRARKRLADSTRITNDRREGLISIEVSDTSPERAANIANAYVERLRELTGALALTEAQERRHFFERELNAARKSLTAAQAALQVSGISEASLRAEPKAAAEALSGARAELALTEIQLRMASRTLADNTPEVQQLLAKVGALRDQLRRLEQKQAPDESKYVDKYRDFKYQEGLVESLSKQFELARLGEQREGALIQVIDRATVPEWKSAPKRLNVAVGTTMVAFLLLALGLMARHAWRLALRDPTTAAKADRLRSALRPTRRR
jgi:uncharacterized protein involved in exopolysaccharide biosynthesis